MLNVNLVGHRNPKSVSFVSFVFKNPEPRKAICHPYN
nr:MAG TPA: hypothetical protein [Caudoviricetes sp.]